MNKEENFQELFSHLLKTIKLGIRLDFNCNRIYDDYSIEGTLRGSKFRIDYNPENEIMVTFNTGANEKNIKLVEESINEFLGEESSVTYSLKDMQNSKVNMHVIEWTKSEERIEKIKYSDDVYFPRFITDVKVKNKENGFTR